MIKKRGNRFHGGLKLTEEYIKEMPYSDFVGLVNQWNVLPGAYSTLSKWAVFSRMSSKSYILEVACTTGFSSRELAVMTNCKGVAFDLSSHAIRLAQYNKKIYAPSAQIRYLKEDGYDFYSKKKFSHIIIGASLKFFLNQNKMLGKCVSLLKDGGYILASPFYVTRKIPSELITRAEKVFGITPTNETYKEIMRMYNGFEIMYEDKNVLIQETKEEIRHYSLSTSNRACKILDTDDKKVFETIFNRILEIKTMSNKLRPYQNYSVLVLRYRNKIYPNRFVELF